MDTARWGDVTDEFCLFARNGFNQTLIDSTADRDDLRQFTTEYLVTAF